MTIYDLALAFVIPYLLLSECIFDRLMSDELSSYLLRTCRDTLWTRIAWIRDEANRPFLTEHEARRAI